MRFVENWAPAIVVLAVLVICHYVPVANVKVGLRCGPGAIWVWAGSGVGVMPDKTCQP